MKNWNYGCFERQNRPNRSDVMSSQSEVVTSEARKSGFFQPSMFQKEPGMAQKIAETYFLTQKILRNPLDWVLKLYLMPFWQKWTIYANFYTHFYDQNKARFDLRRNR